MTIEILASTEIPELVWCVDGAYWIPFRGSWRKLPYREARTWLMTHKGCNSKRDQDAAASAVDAALLKASMENQVEWAGPVAGLGAGIHEEAGERFLVTESPRLIDPKRGEWPTLLDVICNILDGTDGEVRHQQAPLFMQWLRHGLRSLHAGEPTRGLCLVLAGEPNSGKTLMIEILKALFGGKCASPYRYFIGLDNFNQELFEAPLLVIDDESSDTTIQARKSLAAQIKQVVAVSEGTRARGMHRKGRNLSPFWRLVFAVNIEPDALQVLPPITPDIEDKLLILKAYRRPMPMPSTTLEERRAFFQVLLNEMPALVWHLLNEREDDAALSGRFGCKAWAHPQVLHELHEVSPEQATHEMVQRCMFRLSTQWTGTTAELRASLLGDESALTAWEKREVPGSVWIGRRLAKLAKVHPDLYSVSKSEAHNLWTLRAERSSREAGDD